MQEKKGAVLAAPECTWINPIRPDSRKVYLAKEPGLEPGGDVQGYTDYGTALVNPVSPHSALHLNNTSSAHSFPACVQNGYRSERIPALR